MARLAAVHGLRRGTMPVNAGSTGLDAAMGIDEERGEAAVDDRTAGPESRYPGWPSGERRAAAAIAAAALALVVYLGFNAGGFFPGTVALASMALLVVLVVVASVADRPLAAVRGRLVVAVVALAGFALWQLLSSGWSGAPGRAALASQLSVLYVLALIVGAAAGTRASGARALVLGLAGGMVVVCVAGLLSRTLPDVFPVAPDVANQRLGFPLTYWNAMGIVGAVAAILCLGLTGGAAERPAVRVAAAAAIPPLLATILLTFSRGAIAAGVGGLVLLVVLARPRHLLAGLAAVSVPGAVAVIAAYGAPALARRDPTTPAAVSQGQRVIVVVVLSALVAALLRAMLVRVLDRRLARLPALSRRTGAWAWAAVAAATVVTALALSAPARLADLYDGFVRGSAVGTGDDARARLTDPGNNGRLDHWRAAVEGFRADPLRGSGAGTYQNLWNRHRRSEFDVVNAHSLYLEALGEVGLIGLALLAVALLATFAGTVARVRGPDRALWAAVASAMIAWLLETGVDWTWQMPGASVWFFALGGAALARPARDVPAAVVRPAGTVRLVAGLALLLAAVMPVRIALSQQHLREAIVDIRRGDCGATISSSLQSLGALSARAEPYELLGYCDARLGYLPLAQRMVREAIERDPGNWEYRYDLALVRAAAGVDPRPAIRQARRRNPLSGMLVRFERAMATDDPRTWRRRAAQAPLLLPSR